LATQAAKQRNWISQKEAARMIGKTTEFLRVARNNGKEAPPWYRIGDRILYDQDEVESWIQSRKRIGNGKAH
jgi:hypothetical protein